MKKMNVVVRFLLKSSCLLTLFWMGQNRDWKGSALFVCKVSQFASGFQNVFTGNSLIGEFKLRKQHAWQLYISFFSSLEGVCRCLFLRTRKGRVNTLQTQRLERMLAYVNPTSTCFQIGVSAHLLFLIRPCEIYFLFPIISQVFTCRVDQRYESINPYLWVDRQNVLFYKIDKMFYFTKILRLEIIRKITPSSVHKAGNCHKICWVGYFLVGK